MARPERTPPQLLKVPFYEKAAELFRRECPNAPLVGLELERGKLSGQDCWVFAAYSGPRDSTGLTVNHFVPMTKLTWPEVAGAISSLAQTSRGVWLQREEKRRAREKLERSVQSIRERRGDMQSGISGARQA